jgi:hypothetical protein
MFLRYILMFLTPCTLYRWPKPKIEAYIIAGKAKVVESPGKPPLPTIEISSGEENVPDYSSGSEYLDDNTNIAGQPGPAYRRPATRQDSSPTNSTVSPGAELKTTELADTVTQERTEISSSQKLKSPTQSSSESKVSLSKKNKSSLVPEAHVSEIRIMKSTPIPPPKVRTWASHCVSSAQTQETPEKVNHLVLSRNEKTDRASRERAKQSKAIDHDSGEGSDSNETPDTPKPASTIASAIKEQGGSARPELDTENETTDEDSEELDSTEKNHAQTLAVDLALSGSEKGHSSNQREDIQDETTDEELTENSDDMQAEIDNQIFTQSFESTSSLDEPSKFPEKRKTVQKANTEAEVLQNNSSLRPSLRRMNMEAQRTRQADIEAAKARGLEKAQKVGNGIKRTSLLKENSDESFSDSSSDNGDLDNKDAEEMGPQMIAKFTDLGSTSNGNKRYSKESGKIGLAKLGKQFGANKYKD